MPRSIFRKKPLIFLGLLLLFAGCFIALSPHARAQTSSIVMPNINIGTTPLRRLPFTTTIQIFVVMSMLSIAPYFVLMMTSFIRVAIVLSFIRSSLGTQQVPPTQILMGLALFITVYIMAPVGIQMRDQALIPYTQDKIGQIEFYNRMSIPIRTFMMKQVQKEDLMLFLNLAKVKTPIAKKSIPLYVLIPAYMVSEVKIGFEIGFLIYIPFLIIDMVVASVLMSMGMFMLSPMSISLPFKLLLFVMVDGWEIIIKGLVTSFH